MATTPQQGIMALPETDEATTPQLSLNESYDAAKQGVTDVDPKLTAMYDNEMAQAMPALLALSDEELDMILQMIQFLQDNPADYAKNLQELEQAGAVEKGDFPAEYDENFLAVFGAAVLEAQRTNDDTGAGAPAMQPPMQLAKGGIAEAARMVASHGRSGDTMLAHINKEEAALLKKHGGMGTLNPRTGLREYGWNPFKAAANVVKSTVKTVTSAVTSAVKSVSNAVKKVLSSDIGKIAATIALAAFLGPAGAAYGGGMFGTTAAMGLASAGVTALSGGNLKQVVTAGVTGAVAGYGAQALGPALGGTAGVTSAAGQAALGAGATGAGIGLLQGKSIKESVVDGLTAAAVAGTMVGAQQGFNTPADAGKVVVDDTSGKVTTGGNSNVPTQQTTVAQTNASQPTTPAASADPLGDFIVQNEAWRTAANTPVPASVAPPVPEPTWWDKTTDFFSPSARAEAGAVDAGKAYDSAYNKAISSGQSPAAATTVAQAAAKAATPGILSTYGPAIATGLGITGLMGGFTPKQPDNPQFSEESKDIISGKATQDLIDANPSKYLTQNLPGVTYDERGNIVSSAPWTPRSGAGTTEVASAYIPYSPVYTPPTPVYSTPAGAIGGTNRQIAQPYNTASMYDFRPRYAAQGGMMETSGAFPANPLTMSNPAMAMNTHQLPMNTSGVAMNTPMGFANGGMPPAGLASLAVGGYPRRTGQISGPGTPTSDDIPAMLSDGEFVFTEKAVRGMGNGSRRAGAKKMYALMHRLEKNAARG